MLRIAICDDVKAELQHIAALTNEYLSDRGLSAEFGSSVTRILC